LCFRIIEQALFKEAEYFINLILSFDANNADAYWAICLMKIEASIEKKIILKDNLLRDVPEFNRYLTLVNEARRKQCIVISREQIEKRLLRLKNEVDSLVTERKAVNATVGYFFGGCGVFMCVVGMFLFSLNAGELWPFLVAIPEILIAIPCLKKTPSTSVVNENIKKKKELEAKIKELEAKM
jgi:hypothetical protein